MSCIHQPVKLGCVHQPVKLDKMVDGEKDADHIHGDPQEVQDVMPAQYTPHSQYFTSFANQRTIAVNESLLHAIVR